MVTDNPQDHGTEEHCADCTGSGCWQVASSIPLTVKVTVRRSEGDAQTTERILWALQNAIAAIEEVDVGDGVYAIEHVDYNLNEQNDGYGTLYDMTTGEHIGPATKGQRAASDAASETGAFVIDRDAVPVDVSADPAVFGPLRTVYVQP